MVDIVVQVKPAPDAIPPEGHTTTSGDVPGNERPYEDAGIELVESESEED